MRRPHRGPVRGNDILREGSHSPVAWPTPSQPGHSFVNSPLHFLTLKKGGGWSSTLSALYRATEQHTPVMEGTLAPAGWGGGHSFSEGTTPLSSLSLFLGHEGHNCQGTGLGQWPNSKWQLHEGRNNVLIGYSPSANVSPCLAQSRCLINRR